MAPTSEMVRPKPAKPRGVGMWIGGIFLQEGDRVDIDVEGVGRLTNGVA